MLERGRGWIVNISSGVGDETNARPGGAGYGGSKAMLNQMTRCLALELASTPVVVNALSPQAASRTEFVNQLVAADAIASELTEPLDAMAEAILALATAPPSVRGFVVRDLELLQQLGRPVRDLTGTAVVEGYDVADLPTRIQELVEANPRQKDLRGAWGKSWGAKDRPA